MTAPALERALARHAGDPDVRVGVGYANYVEPTSPSYHFTTGHWGGGDAATVRVDPDGSVRVAAGVSAFGQGAETIAAHMLEAAEADVVLTDGAFHVAGSNQPSVSWAQVGTAAWVRNVDLPDQMEAGLETSGYYHPENLQHQLDDTGKINAAASWSNGAHIGIVSVRISTGEVRIEDYIVVHDCGTVINPALVEGQIHGGVAQGIAGAMYEHFQYDPDTANPPTYPTIEAGGLVWTCISGPAHRRVSAARGAAGGPDCRDARQGRRRGHRRVPALADQHRQRRDRPGPHGLTPRPAGLAARARGRVPLGSVPKTEPRAHPVSRNSAPGPHDDDRLPVKMLNDRILVAVGEAEGERRSTGGILIPATAQVGKRLSWAEVVAVGPNVRNMEKGDRVLFNPEDRYEVEVRGRDYIILRERDVHAVAAERLDKGSTGLYL